MQEIKQGMLAQHHRWIFENHRWELVETIKKFVLQEAEFQTVASETIRGVPSSEIQDVIGARRHSLGMLRNRKFRNIAPVKYAKDITEFGVVTNSKICQFKKDGILRNA